MQASAPASASSFESVTKLIPGGEHQLAHLSDSELLANTRRLVGQSNQLFAALLLHLAEVETRGIHRKRACASLYTYCIYELRMSEDAAARRSSAARLVKKFPLVLDAIARGELHLTGLLMLGPHLTLENHVEVLARAKFRTKKEIAKLVRDLHPLPRVPDVVEPLGPEAPRRARRPTWQEWVASLGPAVRELRPGERPCDWANDGDLRKSGDLCESSDLCESGDLCESSDLCENGGCGEDGDCRQRVENADHREGAQHGDRRESADRGASAENAARPKTELGLQMQPKLLPEMAMPSGANQPSNLEERAFGGRNADADADSATVPSRSELPPLPPITAPQQYQMQFTTCEEHAQLVERAKALVARDTPGISLGELHFQAMKLLVAALEKKKFAVTDRPRTKLDQPQTERERSGAEPDRPRTELESSEVQASPDPLDVQPPRRRGVTRGRYVPAAVRRWVYERDGGQCSCVDDRGVRCTETHYLELHHIDPFAKGGEHRVNNLSLRCAAHNAWAAEQDFGREAMLRRRDAARHESFKAQVVEERASDPDD